MIGRIGKLLADRRGATAIEYSLIAALIAMALVGAIGGVGRGSGGIWSNMTEQTTGAMTR